MSKRTSQFQTIRTEGAILPPDILRSIAALAVDGVSADSYHLPPNTKLNEAISQAWTALLAHWKAFWEAREKLPAQDETGTALTNERWLLPLFKELDYGRLTTSKSPEIDGRTYSIERFYQHTPIHLIGCNLPLDRRTRGARGAATASPHSMMQEYLNRADNSLWGFLSNGLSLRILRDNVSLSRQAYVEFDVEAMFDGEVYSDIALLWMLCHQSRVEAENAQDCWLESGASSLATAAPACSTTCAWASRAPSRRWDAGSLPIPRTTGCATSSAPARSPRRTTTANCCGSSTGCCSCSWRKTGGLTRTPANSSTNTIPPLACVSYAARFVVLSTAA